MECALRGLGRFKTERALHCMSQNFTDRPAKVLDPALKTVDFLYIAEEAADLASTTFAILQREIS